MFLCCIPLLSVISIYLSNLKINILRNHKRKELKYMEPVGVAIPAWLVQRKIILYYLIIRDCCWNNQLFTDVIQSAPGGEFYEMVSKHMSAFLQEGKMPPEEIAPAIMNLVDDQTSGRAMTMRAGDYISLQNYLRKAKC
jgi:hypothetical protein